MGGATLACGRALPDTLAPRLRGLPSSRTSGVARLPTCSNGHQQLLSSGAGVCPTTRFAVPCLLLPKSHPRPIMHPMLPLPLSRAMCGTRGALPSGPITLSTVQHHVGLSCNLAATLRHRCCATLSPHRAACRPSESTLPYPWGRPGWV